MTATRDIKLFTNTINRCGRPKKFPTLILFSSCGWVVQVGRHGSFHRVLIVIQGLHVKVDGQSLKYFIAKSYV